MKRIALLGGARGTNEDAFAWARLADAVGIEHRDAQLGDGLPAEVIDLPRATIDSTAAAPTVILLGPDLKEELGPLPPPRQQRAQAHHDSSSWDPWRPG